MNPPESEYESMLTVQLGKAKLCVSDEGANCSSIYHIDDWSKLFLTECCGRQHDIQRISFIRELPQWFYGDESLYNLVFLTLNPYKKSKRFSRYQKLSAVSDAIRSLMSIKRMFIVREINTTDGSGHYHALISLDNHDPLPQGQLSKHFNVKMDIIKSGSTSNWVYQFIPPDVDYRYVNNTVHYMSDEDRNKIMNTDAMRGYSKMCNQISFHSNYEKHINRTIKYMLKSFKERECVKYLDYIHFHSGNYASPTIHNYA